jgi:(S)-2-hydroxyglutarate dehydrogenase
MTTAAPHDVAVIGAGIVGLATARELVLRHPGLRVVVVDKEEVVASHQTGHNSGVIHAGLYYVPGSLKAELCASGRARLERFADEHDIAIERCGKLVIARDADERVRLADLHTRATANGVPDLELLGPAGIAEHEPYAQGVEALRSPVTAIIDFGLVARAMADDLVAAGGQLSLGRAVTRIDRRADRVTLHTATGVITARHVIACAGLQSDHLARSLGDAEAERIVPFRGDYYTLVDGARHLVRGLIYPVPDPRFPFLGVHLTPRVDGAVLAGPNAVLAFAREGYRRRDVDVRELAGIVGDPAFRRLALRHWRTGLGEMWRDVSKRAFLRELQRFVPALQSSDLVFGPSGVRAQALDADGELVDDFRIGGDEQAMTVRNAPSPAATASLAIGSALVDRAEARFPALAPRR